MTLKIENYQLKSKIISLALDDCTAEKFQEKKLSYMLVKNDKLYFWPECIELGISEETKIKALNNFDIFQIDNTGKAYRCFDDSSDDNGLLMTNKCNSNCVMCPESTSQRSKPNCYTVNEIIDIINRIPDDTRHLTITGGEPFMIGNSVFDILDLLKTRLNSTQYLFLTNGRAFSYKPFVDKFIDSAPSDMLIGIPLHGYNSETHDRITQVSGSFTQTYMGISYLLSRKCDIELRIVVSKLNCHIITDIAELIIKNFSDVNRVVIMGLEMLGNAAVNKETVWITYKDAFKAAKPAVDLLVHEGINVKLYNFPWCSVDEGYHMIAAKSISDYKIRFPEQCDNCLRKKECGGLFQGTMRLAKNDVEPVIKYD